MYLVSYFFSADTPLSELELRSAHPHRILNGGGSGASNDCPDEMWARARQGHAELLAFADHCKIKPTIRFEWVKGWPAGYAVCEGSCCSLDGQPEALLPAVIPSDKAPRTPQIASVLPRDSHAN